MRHAATARVSCVVRCGVTHRPQVRQEQAQSWPSIAIPGAVGAAQGWPPTSIHGTTDATPCAVGSLLERRRGTQRDTVWLAPSDKPSLSRVPSVSSQATLVPDPCDIAAHASRP